jgi:hypothetical protein
MPERATADVVRDIVVALGDKSFRMVTRLDPEPPPLDKTSTTHCLAFDGDRIMLALHATREWTMVPGCRLRRPGWRLGNAAPSPHSRRQAAEARSSGWTLSRASSGLDSTGPGGAPTTARPGSALPSC